MGPSGAPPGAGSPALTPTIALIPTLTLTLTLTLTHALSGTLRAIMPTSYLQHSAGCSKSKGPHMHGTLEPCVHGTLEQPCVHGGNILRDDSATPGSMDVEEEQASSNAG